MKVEIRIAKFRLCDDKERALDTYMHRIQKRKVCCSNPDENLFIEERIDKNLTSKELKLKSKKKERGEIRTC